MEKRNSREGGAAAGSVCSVIPWPFTPGAACVAMRMKSLSAAAPLTHGVGAPQVTLVTTLGLLPTLCEIDFRITLGQPLQLAGVGPTGLDR